MARRRCGIILAPCLCTTFIVFVLVPLVVFLFSAAFGAVLYALECPPAIGTADEELLCSVYDWFLYVTGNLVGLGNPLTNVTPVSGHVLAEMVDLMISTWSLAITGTVVGLIGGLAALRSAVDFTNQRIAGATTLARSSEDREFFSKVADGELIAPERFKQAVRQCQAKGGEGSLHLLTNSELNALFVELDKDGSGYLPKEVLVRYLASLASVPFDSPNEADVSSQQLQELSQQLRALSDAISEQQEELSQQRETFTKALSRHQETLEELAASLKLLHSPSRLPSVPPSTPHEGVPPQLVARTRVRKSVPRPAKLESNAESMRDIS